MQIKTTLATLLGSVLLSACGAMEDTNTSEKAPMQTSSTISGSVPGTLIEAFGDNGSYFSVESTHTEDGKHPFTLKLPAGVGFRIVMTTNKGTSDEVVTPIGFRDSSGQQRTRLMLGDSDSINIGHIPLAMSRSEVAALDTDNNGVLDSPAILDDFSEAVNPLLLADADNDGIKDYNDLDSGGYQFDDAKTDPTDLDHDGIHNHYDDDYVADPHLDADRDGIPDDLNDTNPGNTTDGNHYLDQDKDHDGYHDGDHDHDGYHDEDSDHDGYLDDDTDRDGYHDDDHDHDGFHDDDTDQDGYHDDDHDHDGFHDEDTDKDDWHL